MKKKLIRLTEGDLHRVIKESVNKVLTELDWKTYQSAADKEEENFANALKNGDPEYYKHERRQKEFAKAAKDAFNKEYGYNDDNDFNFGLQHDFGDTRKPIRHLYDNNPYLVYPNGDYSKPLRPDHEVYSRNPQFPMTKRGEEVFQRGDEELSNYFDNKYDHQKGKGWVKK